MKLQNIVKILDILCGVLVIIILIIIFFGCFKKNSFERFENTLNEHQKQIIEGVKGGKIDSELISKYIKEDKLKKEDLDTVVSYLLENGYADTEKSAQNIMEAMSENWLATILDETLS